MSAVYQSLEQASDGLVREECDECFRDCLRWISEDGAIVPAHQRDWRIGKTFSWHYVKNVEYRTSQLILSIEVMTMAAKGKKNVRSNDFGGYSFVKCELTSDDRKAAKIWIEANTDALGGLLHDAVASDLKFSLSFSSEFDTFTACLVGKEDHVFNAKKTITARHKDWVIAALTVLYKHLVMFKGTVWESTAAEDDDGWA